MKDPIRIAVLVSGGGTNLQALIDAEGRGEIPSGRLALVVSNKPGAYALERAKAAGIETAVIPYKMGTPREIFEEQLAALLEEKNIGMIVYAGFMLILGPNFVAKYPKRMINVHPALIPAFCGKGMYGLHVHEAALAYGVKVSGATVHYVSEVCDGGEIILQKAVDVLDGDTPETLQKRIMEQAEWVLLPKAAELVCARLRGKED
ncbi:MAG: phosphoribosylglycinamide formyltransferase [Oscillospiraceae bacterium]|nr:phosphoribosylglycinamide formyltransferase [Oscillospiraceae bacterium]